MREGFARVDEEFVKVRQEAAEFRSEVKQEFANVRQEAAEFRAEVREGFARVDREFAKVCEEIGDFRGEVRGEFKAAHARMDGMDTRMDRIEKTMKEGFDQARQLTLVLHEQLRSDIKSMGEGLPRKEGPQA
jgi:hypothetical protein